VTDIASPCVFSLPRTSSNESVSLEDFVFSDDAQLYGQLEEERSSNQSLPLTPSPSSTAINKVSTSNSEASVSVTSHQVVLPMGMIVSQSRSHSLRSLLESATITIQNPYSTLSSLHTHLSSLSLPSTHRLRPSWDTYFLSLCTLASLRSNCMKRRVGAVLIRNNRVLSTGYNGTARGLTNCAEGGCSRCNGGAAGGTALNECLCLHAEENALLECGRERGGAEGTVLYCNT
jgi:dCMP deaminase